MSERIKPRDLTSQEVAEVLSLKRSDINATLLKNYFACFYGEEHSRFQPNDRFVLKKGTLYNSTDITTTIGRYIYNLFALPESYLKENGYLNETLNKDTLESLEAKMGSMILNDTMTTKDYASIYMDHTEWLAMNCAYYITPSLNKKNILPIPKVIDKKNELFDKYKKDLDSGDINTTNKVEAELLSLAKDEVKKIDDAGFDNFDSGAFSFNNSYKKSSIMIGAIKELEGNKLHIIKSDYTDGCTPEDYAKTSLLTVVGGYSRGVATQDYGYESKKFNNALQNVVVEHTPENLDCGTDKYLEVTIDPKLKNMFLYRYIIDNGKIVELTNDNINNYVGKPVKLRSPMCCKGDVLCEHCAGSLFRRIDITNAGLVCFNLTGNLMNLSMKKMHDSTVTMLSPNIEDFITEV